jgi:hypothetical protein
MTTTTPTPATAYAAAVRYAADSVLAQIEDGHAPHRQYNSQSADGQYRPSVRVYFCDLPYRAYPTIPAGAVRVAVDLDPTRGRWPVHEARVYFEPHDYDAGQAAADIAAAVLDMIDNTAEYAH